MRKAEYKAELLREIKMASETLSWKLSDEEHEGIKNYIKKDIEKYIKIKNGGYFMGMDYYIDGEKEKYIGILFLELWEFQKIVKNKQKFQSPQARDNFPEEEKKMTVTRKDIIEYRKIKANNWHDQKWHDFMNREKSEAIAFAIQEHGRGVSYAEISECAENYLKTRMIIQVGYSGSICEKEDLYCRIENLKNRKNAVELAIVNAKDEGNRKFFENSLLTINRRLEKEGTKKC